MGNYVPKVHSDGPDKLAIESGGSIEGVSHLALNTQSDSAQVRINSRNFTQVTGDSIGAQIKPAQAATLAGDVYVEQVSPRLLDGFGAASIIGGHFEPILKGTTGNISGDVRAWQSQVTDENVGGRTIAGDVIVGGRLWHMIAHTVSGDVVGFRFDTAGGSRAWTAAFKFAVGGTLAVDKVSSGIAFSTLANNGNSPAKFAVKIGSTVYYVPCYNNA